MRRVLCVMAAIFCLVGFASADALAAAKFSYGSTWWGGGFDGKISFENDSGNKLEQWKATFNVPFEITSIWSASIDGDVEESDGSHTYSVSGPDWNKNLAAGAVLEFGFNGKTEGTLSPDMVKSFVLSSGDSSPPSGDGSSSGDSGGTTGDSSSGSVSAQSAFTITSDWGAGFGGKADVTVASAVNGWALEFDFSGNITSIWNAKILEHNGNHYKVGPLDWNGNVASGSAISFGFNGQPGNVDPSAFTNVSLNGAAVSIGGGSGTTDGSDSGTGTGSDTGSGGTDSGSGTDSGAGTGTGTDSGTDDGTTGTDTGSDGGATGGGNPTGYTGRKVIANFAQWGIYGRDYQVADIPAHKLTHINYAFVGIDGTTLKVKSVDEYADFEKVFPAENGLPAQSWADASLSRAGNFGRLRQLKQKYPHIKLMLSVGGWTLSTFFSDVALTGETRERFAASAVDMMIHQGFDGIDLDWEYPVSGGLPQPPEGLTNAQMSIELEKQYQRYRPVDRDNYVHLLREIRRQLDEKTAETGDKYELTIAGPAGSDKIANYDLRGMMPYLDFINLMAYDFHGGWENVTGHHAAMVAHPSDNGDVSIESAVQTYLSMGVPSEKLVLGVPFYGRAWEGVQSTENGVFQPSTGIPAPSGPGHWEAGAFDYWLISQMIDDGRTTLFWDSNSKCSYAYGANISGGKNGGMFITFDDVRSIKNKTDYIKAQKLGGALLWELSGDIRDVDNEKSLLGALANGLLESGAIGDENGVGSGGDSTDDSSVGDSGSGSTGGAGGSGTSGEVDSGEAAVGAPAKPVMAWVSPVQSYGDYSVAWNMWWGDNAIRWALFENGVQVHSEDLTPNSPQAQAGSAALTGRDSGQYIYTVRLYGTNGAYSESNSVTINVGSGSTGSSNSGDTTTETPVVDAGDGSRYDDDRDETTFILDENLAFQIHVNEFQTRTFNFDKQITRVLSRNPDVAEIFVSGSSIEISGMETGRTGLRIDTADGKTYFTGLRVDSSSGELPGMPEYLAVGSGSEDTPEDLMFWKDMGEEKKGRRMDIRYIYINGGPINGWTTWGNVRARLFARESLKFGMIPFFVFYNIPDTVESYVDDLKNVQDANYMAAYHSNLEFFLSEVTTIMKGELYGVILEPDFLGYMQQNSGKRAYQISTADGTVVDTVKRINKTISEKGDNVHFGWQLNLWAKAGSNGGRGLIRRTDFDDWAQMGWDAGRIYIAQIARDIAAYAVEAGVLSHSADFLSIDKYGLDAGVKNPDDPFNSPWFWNSDHWSSYLLVAEEIKRESGLPVILWQVPVGHINQSTATSAYTGEKFPELTNTHINYEDSATTWFLGDTFKPGNQNRMAHFLGNKVNDSKFSASSDSITWGSHMEETARAGVTAVLFGAGVGQSTDGVGSPPSEDYFWIQKVQEYYSNGPAPLR